MSSAPILTPDHAALASLRSEGFEAERIEQVLAHYDEPHRYYHDRAHLREMFDEVLDLGLRLTAAQSLAILFHDAIYVPGAPRGSNEAMSAQLLRVYGDGISRALVDAAFEIVIDTAEHLAHGPESELVLDLDLMRLAAGPGAFARYSRQVFLEQRPLILIENDVDAWRFFSERRIQFFERLLERPTIFCLPVFRRRYESIARDNILAAIAQVRGSGSRERL